MRYLEIKQISEVSQILTQMEEENPEMTFILEPYSCKASKKEKKKNDNNSSKANLAHTLNLTFTDYSFSDDKLDEFCDISNANCKKEVLDFFEMSKIDSATEAVNGIFAVIDRAIDLKKSEIYSYDQRDGPFEECRWFFCFLFYNKKMKRILLFAGMLNKNM